MGGDGGKRLCGEDGGEIRGRCNGLCHPIEESVDNHETIRLSETAHGLKGICRNIGADILAQVPYELEQASAGKLNREIPAFLGKICREFQRVQIALTEVTSDRK